MRRFFTEPENIKENLAYIYDDASHISKVLRLGEGEDIIVFDGSGYEYLARLKTIGKSECVAEIYEKKESKSEPKIKVTLFQGVPKSGKMEQIIQKCTELGIYRVVPVMTERCVVKFSDKKSTESKIARWQKVAVEAAKQSGRGIIPQVSLPMKFSEAAEFLAQYDLAVMPYELLGHEGGAGLREAVKGVDGCKTVGIMVGPEGGFSGSEAELAKSLGIRLCGLGRRILRTETVGAALTAILMYENNEM